MYMEGDNVTHHRSHFPQLKPNGFWQVVQAILTSVIVAIFGYVASSVHDSAVKAATVSEEQQRSLIILQQQMATAQTQLAAQTDVVSSLVRITTKLEAKIEEDERRLNEVEQTRRLK